MDGLIVCADHLAYHTDLDDNWKRFIACHLFWVVRNHNDEYGCPPSPSGSSVKTCDPLIFMWIHGECHKKEEQRLSLLVGSSQVARLYL